MRSRGRVLARRKEIRPSMGRPRATVHSDGRLDAAVGSTTGQLDPISAGQHVLRHTFSMQPHEKPTVVQSRPDT